MMTLGKTLEKGGSTSILRLEETTDSYFPPGELYCPNRQRPKIRFRSIG